jgi:hypothetical protein
MMRVAVHGDEANCDAHRDNEKAALAGSLSVEVFK